MLRLQLYYIMRNEVIKNINKITLIKSNYMLFKKSIKTVEAYCMIDSIFVTGIFEYIYRYKAIAFS
ncbi:hypothetical protein CS063_16115 [Sporanaerobium hydrogeniformans]|uniref:Uncharacterized protein n=1 Tax=Sporanaerobium hydrogeniformans TaxID=3072179 RepID=A0AC61D9I7_9FIRM|nr:hypothetical protein CS063_16115 [Sporanaerobium hydrogeniformans]